QSWTGAVYLLPDLAAGPTSRAPMPAVPIDIRRTLGGLSSDTKGRLYRAVVRGRIAMKVWLIGVLISLAAMALAVIVTNGGQTPRQRTQSAVAQAEQQAPRVGPSVGGDGQRRAEQVSSDTAQPRTAPPRLERPPSEARPTLLTQMDPHGSLQ